MSFQRSDGPTYADDQDHSLAPFDALIGTWTTEAIHPSVDAVVSRIVTFEWLEGGHFLPAALAHDQELFPDALGVIGAPAAGDGLVMEYFDSRGVRRTYGVSLASGVLRFWGEFPEFAQRFSAALGRDAFAGLWQLARTPGDWQDDLSVTYSR